jgi:hypothetical protein
VDAEGTAQGGEPGGEARAGGAAGSAARHASLRLPLWVWLGLWMALWVGSAVAVHYAAHAVVNPWHVALSVFLAINVLICVWEISLWHRIGDIERWFRQPRGSAGDRPSGPFYTARFTLSDLASTRLWARVWLGYAWYDDGYADRKSFGFAIDVGNGFSTLIPSLLFAVGMTFPIFSPVVLGIVGLLIFYQKLYCTLLYFFQYLFNRRYRGRPLSGVLGMVGGTNGIWLVFPAVGIAVCLRLILDGRFDVLWS